MHGIAYVLTTPTSPSIGQLMALHRRTPDDPCGEWDACVIGGRWFGHFGALDPLDAGGNVTTAGRLLPVLESNDDFVPCAVVTPEGRWRDEMAYDGSHWNFKAAADWSAEVRALMAQAGADAVVTTIDYHF